MIRISTCFVGPWRIHFTHTSRSDLIIQAQSVGQNTCYNNRTSCTKLGALLRCKWLCSTIFVQILRIVHAQCVALELCSHLRSEICYKENFENKKPYTYFCNNSTFESASISSLFRRHSGGGANFATSAKTASQTSSQSRLGGEVPSDPGFQDAMKAVWVW